MHQQMALIYYRKKDQCKIKSPILHILQTTAASSVNFLYHLSVVHKMFRLKTKMRRSTLKTKNLKMTQNSPVMRRFTPLGLN